MRGSGFGNYRTLGRGRVFALTPNIYSGVKAYGYVV